eukprot:GHVS01061411.1.p1 GENE.GHVS01061411.1~~GHVS01061411.1.p1  ORF type:complete len:119 (+),score=9.72 GHVS01061411.1:121-477(+)
MMQKNPVTVVYKVDQQDTHKFLPFKMELYWTKSKSVTLLGVQRRGAPLNAGGIVKDCLVFKLTKEQWQNIEAAVEKGESDPIGLYLYLGSQTDYIFNEISYANLDELRLAQFVTEAKP